MGEGIKVEKVDSNYVLRIGSTDIVIDGCDVAAVIKEIDDAEKEMEEEMKKSDIVKESLRKYDSGKPDFSLIPPLAQLALAKVLTHGAVKYGPGNWMKATKADRPRYLAALLRHLNAWQSGEHDDPESGLSHLAHALCNLTFLVHFDESDSVVSDN